MPAGRPTKYNDEVLKKTKDYCDGVWLDEGDAFPSNNGLALYLNVNRDTIYEWGSKHKEFSDILDRIHLKQERVAWKNGMTGDYNSNLCKLLLGKHGYSEKSETAHTGAYGGSMKIEHMGSMKIEHMSRMSDDDLSAIVNGSS